jgi:DNA-binding LacI/PurR family transcriptional regulator
MVRFSILTGKVKRQLHAKLALPWKSNSEDVNPCYSNRDGFACIVQLMTVRMMDIAKDLGVSIVTVSKVIRNHPDIAEEIQQLVGRQLDALVVASSEVATESFERMYRQGQRYLWIDRDFPGLSANFVGIDDEAAGRMATEHLVDQGCKTIAHIRGPNVSTGNQRFEGYQRALVSRGLGYSDRYVMPGRSADIGSTSHGAEAMRLLLEQTPKPDGVFCFNDPLAIGEFLKTSL